jgi:phosphomethylpyrimidine synthase
MKITQEVRDYARKGMDQMSEKFKEKGSEIYQPVEEIDAEKVRAPENAAE